MVFLRGSIDPPKVPRPYIPQFPIVPGWTVCFPDRVMDANYGATLFGLSVDR